MRGGVTTPDELRRIADVADKYEVPIVKITGGQRIDLLGVRKEQLPAIWEDLGMPSGHAYAKARAHGQDVRRHRLLPLRPRATRSASASSSSSAMEGLYTPHKVKSAVTGCPRNCAEAYVKDIGLVAVEGGWEIYVGGAGGRHRAQGRPARDGRDAAEEAMRLRARLPAALPRVRRSTWSAPTPTSSASALDRREAVLERRRPRGLLRALPDRQGGGRPRPVARAPRPGPPAQFAELDGGAAQPSARARR